MAERSFIIPGRFNPARSLLSRWIRVRSVDARQAASTYVVVAVLSVLGLIMIHFVGWSLFRPSGHAETIAFLGAAAAFFIAYTAVAFVGRDKAITIRTDAASLSVSRRDGDALSVPYDDIDAVSRIDAILYHRHYRRYAQTRAFVNRMKDPLLLLRANGIPVVLGLSEDDLYMVEDILRARSSVGLESSHVDVA